MNALRPLWHQPFIPLVLCLVGLLSGCSLFYGTPESGPVAGVAAYRLTPGPAVKHPYPLPTMTPIYVEHTGRPSLPNKLPRLAFRAWDFNDDGRYDLVEVLDARGHIFHRLYDLDFDGVVDAEQQAVAAAAVH